MRLEHFISSHLRRIRAFSDINVTSVLSTTAEEIFPGEHGASLHHVYRSRFLVFQLRLCGTSIVKSFVSISSLSPPERAVSVS